MSAGPDRGFHLEDLRRTDDAAAVRAELRAGLTATPRELLPTWLYDETGSALFDEITRVPEYYPTRRERAILTARSGEIAAATGATTLMELGSGTSDKTRVLLAALVGAGSLRRYVPVDIDEVTLSHAGVSVAAEFPTIEVHGVAADFLGQLTELAGVPREPDERRLVAFLGGTIGNLDALARKDFFADVRAGLEPGDGLLLGADLVKDTDRLLAAYDDAAGITAAFDRNVLRVLDREFAGDFVPEAFDHVARWDVEAERIEMWLVAASPQHVRIADLDLTLDLAAGEGIRTEMSHKFRRDRIEAELADAGFRLRAWWTDPAGDYSLSLAVPA